MADPVIPGELPTAPLSQPGASTPTKPEIESKKLKTVRPTRPRGKTVRPDESTRKLWTPPPSLKSLKLKSLEPAVQEPEPSIPACQSISAPSLPTVDNVSDNVPVNPVLSLLDDPAVKAAAVITAPASPNITITKQDAPHSSAAPDFDVEELCRKKGLKRVFGVINEDDNAESEVERMADKLFTRSAMVKVFDQCKKIVNSLDKLQRHFGVIKDKLYRARCIGMDQGIEAVQKGESPFLEQHMLKINKTCEEELKKAKDLLSVRIESIDLEYDTAVKALWDSVESELERKQRLRKVRVVEQMIQHESDFMQSQLRHLCTHLKNQLQNGGSVTRVFNGVLINTGTEVSIEESVADLWKIMKASIRQKYWNKYLSPEAEAEMHEQERTDRRRLIQEYIVDQREEPVSEEIPKRSGTAGNGSPVKRKKMTNTRNKDSGHLVGNDGGVDNIRSVSEDSTLPGVHISLPDTDAEIGRNF